MIAWWLMHISIQGSRQVQGLYVTCYSRVGRLCSWHLAMTILCVVGWLTITWLSLRIIMINKMPFSAQPCQLHSSDNKSSLFSVLIVLTEGIASLCHGYDDKFRSNFQISQGSEPEPSDRAMFTNDFSHHGKRPLTRNHSCNVNKL